MSVLIVEASPELGGLWKRHLERHGFSVELVATGAQAIDRLRDRRFEVIVLNIVLPDDSGLAVADFASYRHPEARVIFVTSTSFFSDGSIFCHSANACAFVQSHTPPDDLAAMVAHFGGADA